MIDTIFIIPGGGTDNDKQIALSFYIDGLIRFISTYKTIQPEIMLFYLGDLMGGGGTGVDKQRFDTSTITNDTLVQSLQRDS